MAYAAAHPTRVDRMILVGPGGPTLEFTQWFNDNIRIRLQPEDIEAQRYWDEAPKRGVDVDKAALESFRAITAGILLRPRERPRLREDADGRDDQSGREWAALRGHG